MQQLNLKPTHKLVKSYYEALGQFGRLDIDHEGAVRDAFQDLLKGCGRQFDWKLVPEYPFHPPKLNPIRIDGALLDAFRLARGFWEAKDEHDDLDKEIRAKLEKGYPRNNIIFQAPKRAVLIQNGVRQGLNEDIRDSGNLVELLKEFFAYREPHYEEWDAAVADFKDHIPQVAEGIKEKIEQQRRTNRAFVERFDAFYALCRQAINPNLSVEAVETMLIQHLMTERIFRKIFDNPDFTRRNVIAAEIDKMIDSMTEKELSRDTFLRSLDHFYRAIELAAENTETYKQKQDFINTVYERFFQGYSPKEADTHGIVYTPQPIVDFMVRSVEDILKKEFGRSLSDKGVHILDPFVGTGNFITRVMKEIKTSALPYKYENELHCNEVMLLPYYVASMNIEHEYRERTGEYKAFPGICLVDTFDMRAQSAMFAEENTARIARQRLQPIFIVLGNPPYNAWQLNENDNNKNRKYPELDRRISETYAKASKATNKNALSDPYVKAFRWASDRIKDEGVVALVTNSGFIDALAADGMRKTLAGEFDEVYILDLGGNVRKNPKLSGTTHNVFGIQVGVSINILVRLAGKRESRHCQVYVAQVGEVWKKEQKYDFLEVSSSISGLKWELPAEKDGAPWNTKLLSEDFQAFLPISDKSPRRLFQSFSYGVQTNKDAWIYNHDPKMLEETVRKLIETYNGQVHVIEQAKKKGIEPLLESDGHRIKWSSRLRECAQRGQYAEFNKRLIRVGLYRPFTKLRLYFDPVFVHRRSRVPVLFPFGAQENTVIVCSDIAHRSPFTVLLTAAIPDFHLCATTDTVQCFPFYTHDEHGSNRRENITDWALNEFHSHYSDPNITKWDIFHYVYAVLHHPEYRERYAANLKRELPRIPFVGGGAGLQASVSGGINSSSSLPKASAQPARAERLKETADPSTRPPTPTGAKPAPVGGPGKALARDDKDVFRAFVEAGRLLAELHVNYEQQSEHPLERTEKGQLNWRVEKMRLGKDKTTLFYNEFLTLRGIPPETYEYRLGNRSALEWVIDQYQVSTDKRSGITNDPNRADDPEYIVRLIGQVITVSLETVKIVKSLPPLITERA